MKNLRSTPEKAKEVIAALGGNKEVSRLFGIAPSSVTNWAKNGIPEARFMYIKERYKRHKGLQKILFSNS